jgi:enamine deaminase RidA (YjgF/YER057c/UK114 family)
MPSEMNITLRQLKAFVLIAELESFSRTAEDNMPPGRATVQVARLPRDVLVEVAFIAVK